MKYFNRIVSVSFVALTFVIGGAYAAVDYEEGIASVAYVKSIGANAFNVNQGPDASNKILVTNAEGVVSTASQLGMEDVNGLTEALAGKQAAGSYATTAQVNAKVATAQGTDAANKAVITNSSGNITTGTIASGMIASNAVTTAKIADSNVTDAKIASVSMSKVTGLSDALAAKAVPSDINNATLTIQRNGTTVDTFTANASSNKTINIVDNDTVYTLPTASASTKGGIKVGTNLSIDSNGVLSATDTIPNNATLTIQRNGTTVDTFTANASSNKTINIVDNDTVYTLPTASASTKGGIKVGTNLSIDSNGVLSATDTVPNNATLTIAKNGTSVGTFTANASAAKTVDVPVGTGVLTIQRNGTTVDTFSADATSNKTINIVDNDTVYTLPNATTSVKGGVIVGSNISVSSGTISVASATPSVAGVAKIGLIPSGSQTATTYANIWVQ